jgi:hypothetical protein
MIQLRVSAVKLRPFALCQLATVFFATIGVGHAQGISSISSGGQRVFVTGFTPVIGPRGVVGGIDVDTNGVLVSASDFSGSRLRKQATAEKPRDLARHGEIRNSSPMRMISLAKLETAIQESVEAQSTLTDDILFLAGLQRIQYVFACPDAGDIVLAGPADDWELRDGQLLGIHNHEAILHLDDLLDALQSSTAAFHGKGISCSIDPTKEGSQRLQTLLRRSNPKLDLAGKALMEQAMGAQVITLTGIRKSSHFSRVLVGSDYLMKRIAMGLDPPPLASLPSYLDLMKHQASGSQILAPRFWLTPKYDTTEKSVDELVWHFQGPGLRAMTENGYLNQDAQLVNAGPNPGGQQWADIFSDSYEELAVKQPVFGQLSGCVDLAIVAAIIAQNDLARRSGCPLLLLSDANKIRGQTHSVPKSVSSLASVTRGRKGWIVSVSGGVDLDVQSVLKTTIINHDLKNIDPEAKGDSWWWDSSPSE